MNKAESENRKYISMQKNTTTTTHDEPFLGINIPLPFLGINTPIFCIIMESPTTTLTTTSYESAEVWRHQSVAEYPRLLIPSVPPYTCPSHSISALSVRRQ